MRRRGRGCCRAPPPPPTRRRRRCHAGPCRTRGERYPGRGGVEVDSATMTALRCAASRDGTSASSSRSRCARPSDGAAPLTPRIAVSATTCASSGRASYRCIASRIARGRSKIECELGPSRCARSGTIAVSAVSARVSGGVVGGGCSDAVWAGRARAHRSAAGPSRGRSTRGCPPMRRAWRRRTGREPPAAATAAAVNLTGAGGWPDPRRRGGRTPPPGRRRRAAPRRSHNPVRREAPPGTKHASCRSLAWGLPRRVIPKQGKREAPPSCSTDARTAAGTRRRAAARRRTGGPHP